MKKTELCKQEYSNCHIAAGSVEGATHPEDTIYLEFSSKADQPESGSVMLLMRLDEAMAALWVLSGSIWSLLMSNLPEPKEE